MPDPQMTSALTTSYGYLILKMILASSVVIGLAIVVLKYILPRIAAGRRNQKSAIQILDYQAIDVKKALYIVQIENKRVALGVTEQSVTKILDLSDVKDELL